MITISTRSFVNPRAYANITKKPHLIFFFFNDTATTEIYTLSLHDALPISPAPRLTDRILELVGAVGGIDIDEDQDRKSTRLNSSHSQISYAVFCLKKNTTSEWSPV